MGPPKPPPTSYSWRRSPGRVAPRARSSGEMLFPCRLLLPKSVENDPLKMLPPSRGTKLVCGPSPITSAVRVPGSWTVTSSMVAGLTAELKLAPPIGVPMNMPSRSCVLRRAERRGAGNQRRVDAGVLPYRKRLHRVAREDLLLRHPLHVDERRGAGHGDRFGELADAKVGVDRRD